MLQDLITESQELRLRQEEENIWKNSKLEDFHYLSADYSGKAGEKAFLSFLNRTKSEGLHSWIVDYQGDSNINQKDGTYDMVIYNSRRNRVGVKTGRIGKSKSFQHDSLHDNKCEVEILLDILPDYAYITILDYRDYSLRNTHPIFGITPHLRKSTDDNFKMDLRETHLVKGIHSEVTLKIDSKTLDSDIISLISRFLD